MSPDASLVIVPRERFNLTGPSLEDVLANTPPGTPLIYVDANSPRATARYLGEMSAVNGFELIRKSHYLAPNWSRNLAIGRIKTKYVAFLDNDVLVKEGWLEALVRCAEETGAWVVSPLGLIGDFEKGIIHMAGGHARVAQRDNGWRYLDREYRFVDQPLGGLAQPLESQECGFAEFHCMLVRSDIFEKVGPFDPKMLSVLEHFDFCLTVQEAGGKIWFEPGSVMTYIPPPPLAWSDLPFFLRRWSEEWNAISIDRFREKWNLNERFRPTSAFFRRRRLMPVEPLLRWAGRTWGEEAEKRLIQALSSAETALNKHVVSPPRWS